MVRLKRNFTDTSQFDNGILPWGKALAASLQWLYDDDEFEDDSLSEAEYDRNILYCMDGVLPICDFMSMVTDVIYLAFKDFGEPNIKDYINRIMNNYNMYSPPVIKYDGDSMIIGKVIPPTVEVILWAAFLYCRLRREFEPKKENVLRADKLLYKLYAKQTCLKPELVKTTFLMKHFNQTMVKFLKAIPTTPEQNEAETSNTKVNTMAQSVLDKISANNLNYYYEGWRNGKKGGISQEKGIYRFHEMRYDKGGILDSVNRKEDDNPIVAVGIVAYWLMFNSNKELILKRLTRYTNEIPENVREMFETYTKERFKQFKESYRNDPYKSEWEWEWEYEFYTKYIIPHEIALNKQSEALFDYISDSDIHLVQGVMNYYIRYLKRCRSERGYHVKPELLVLRGIDSQDETKMEDLEDFEVNTVLDKLENMGCVKVAWVEGHRPEAVRLLDKGRFYLKALEEGKRTDDIEYDPTSQQSAIKTTPQGLPQTQPQVPEKEDENWDDSFDGVFTAGINPQKVFSKLEKRDDPRVHEFYPRFFVFFRVLLFLGWIENHQKHFLEWANHHWECGWKKPHNFKFGNNIQKELRDADMSTWNDKTCNGSDIGDAYRNLAKGVLELFSEKTDDNKIKDRVEFYVDSEACLINNGENLDYPF